MTIDAKYVHTNLIARDWRKLAHFYQDVFGCTVVAPERHYKGSDLERGTGVPGTELHGVHLRLPGCGDAGPTLEIYSYSVGSEPVNPEVNRPGFAHIAFSVPDVGEARTVLLRSGGAAVGDIVTLITTAGDHVTWCYMRDPEGNIIELQSWSSGK
jgi:catechol 2,3-dioxygenase-like lactoylglutathione lyase family enzyme